MRASRRSTQVSESGPSQKKEKENLNVNRKWGLYKGEEKSQSSAGESASASKGPTSQRRTTRARVAAEYENASTPPEQGIIRGHADNGVWSQAGQTPLSNITPLVAEPVVARQQLYATKARLSLSKEDGENEDGVEDEENEAGGSDSLTARNTAVNSTTTTGASAALSAKKESRSAKKESRSMKTSTTRQRLRVGEMKEVLYDGDWFDARILKVLKSKHVDVEFVIDNTTLRIAPSNVPSVIRDPQQSSSSSSSSSSSIRSSSNNSAIRSSRSRSSGGSKGSGGSVGTKDHPRKRKRDGHGDGGVLASLGPLVASSRRGRGATLLARSNVNNRPPIALDSLQHLVGLKPTKKANTKKRR